MKNKYRMFRRGRSGIYHWQEIGGTRQGSLQTDDKAEAQRLLNAKNESHRQPLLNLALAKVYLAAHDPAMITRTWQVVMNEMATHGIDTTQERCRRAFRSQAYDPIRKKPIVQTTAADLLAIMHASGNSVSHYLRRLHNLALDLGWLAWPVLATKAWPKICAQPKRAITADEHSAIVASEKSVERRAYYEVLWETGAAQTDAANLAADQVDWIHTVLIYRRKKLGSGSEPARLMIGSRLASILRLLPCVGSLFPKMKALSAKERAAEFRRRCRVAGVNGVTLHSYRYAWAERAKAAGYPQRFAQAALGHSSRAVHEAYAKGAAVICPPLEQFERERDEKIVVLGQGLSRTAATQTAEQQIVTLRR